MKLERDHALDAARGILMMLGIALHTANIYTPHANWIVADPSSRAAFGWMASAIHVFRMPAFFLVSGYFTAMTVRRNGPLGLLRLRLPRLLIPFFTVLLTLNVLQDWVVASASGMRIQDISALGLHVHHLWFLPVLAAFVTFSGALYALQPNGIVGSLGDNVSLLAILGLPFAQYGVELATRATGLADNSILGIATGRMIAEYLPYFLAGTVMYSAPTMRERIIRTSPWLLAITLPVATALSHIQDEWRLGGHDLVRWQIEILWLVQLGATWACVAAILAFFLRVFREGSEFTRLVSESAYSVYLFQQFFVVVFGLLLLRINVGPWLKFVFICTATFAITYMIHERFISRYRLLRVLFNGRSEVRTTSKN